MPEERVRTVEEQLRLFCADSVRGNNYTGNRLWLHDDKMSVYVRYTRTRCVAKDVVGPALDIADVQINEESQQQGLFTRLLVAAECFCPWPILYVESAASYLANALARLHYRPAMEFACYWKEKKEVDASLRRTGWLVTENLFHGTPIEVRMLFDELWQARTCLGEDVTIQTEPQKTLILAELALHGALAKLSPDGFSVQKFQEVT